MCRLDLFSFLRWEKSVTFTWNPFFEVERLFGSEVTITVTEVTGQDNRQGWKAIIWFFRLSCEWPCVCVWPLSLLIWSGVVLPNDHGSLDDNARRAGDARRPVRLPQPRRGLHRRQRGEGVLHAERAAPHGARAGWQFDRIKVWPENWPSSKSISKIAFQMAQDSCLNVVLGISRADLGPVRPQRRRHDGPERVLHRL